MRFATGLLILSVLMIGSSFAGETKLTPGETHSCSHFGLPIATSGTRLVVGGRCESAGVVFVFELSGESWIETAKLTASDGQVDDSFGRSVAVSGNVIVVGDTGDDAGGMNSGGAVYAFEFIEGSWVETAKLIASEAQEYAPLGSAVAVSGNVIVAGAPWEDTDEYENVGAAYVFEKSEGSWNETAKLTPSVALQYLLQYGLFGSSVAVDGNMIVVGAPGRIDTYPWPEAAYVFELEGGSWVQTSRLTQSELYGLTHFGSSVALSGNMIVVGAAWEHGDVGRGSGAVHLFELSDEASWNQTAKLRPSDAGDYDRFAESVAVSGNVIVVGAPGCCIDKEWGHEPGVYVFELPEGGSWNETAKLTRSDDSSFGDTVAMAGNVIFARASNYEEPGVVYVLDGCGNGIVETDLGEECDVGNFIADDDCTDSCEFESVFTPAVILTIIVVVMGVPAISALTFLAIQGSPKPETRLNLEASNSSSQTTSPEADSVAKAPFLGEDPPKAEK